MREIHRIIASAIIFSADGKILMGKKPSAGGGSYADCWHIPGGGQDVGESLLETMLREVNEETGLNVSSESIQELPTVGKGVAEKMDKETGEAVLAYMDFRRFEVRLGLLSNDALLSPTEEFAELRWFARDELQAITQIPGGKEFFVEMGYMD